VAQIRIENLCKTFGAFTAVQASTFTIEDGEFFMLLGPSGCGKTTTLRMMAGLDLPTSGKIYIDDEEVGMKRASQRDIAFVFQMFALYPHMNVGRNMAYPLLSQGMPRKQARAKVREAARILGIEHILDKPVGGLSGGDRQRVALGRAIVREPKAFFMDEPLGALDAEFRERMAEELRALHDRMGATTVYVTHDQLEAMQMGDRIVVMNHGVVEQFGVPQEIYDWPATRFVAQFIGSSRARQAVARRTPGAHPLFRSLRLSRRSHCHRVSRHHANRDDRNPARNHQGARAVRQPGDSRGVTGPRIRCANPDRFSRR